MRMKKSLSLALALVFLLLLFSGCIANSEKTTVKTKDLIWAVGVPLPAADAFFEEIPEGAEVSFADENPFGSLKTGENEIRIIVKPQKGKKQTVTATLYLIKDTTGPVIQGAKDLIVYVGEGVSYRSGISLTDNCGGELTLNVDSIAVDTTREGVYPVIYTATDLSGNTSTVIVNVHVYEQKITEEMLYEKIDPIILQLGLGNMTKEAQARTIYRFVHTDAKISYVDTSDKTSWVRAAYFALEDRKGDCFSYFSLSKAFFERLGIENLNIQRLPGYTDDTHYWSLINIGTSEAPLWYHYDSTRLRDISYEGSLLTDAQIEAFHEIRPYFYLYDKTQYPMSATAIITVRPDL